jgi:hypothetical protein
MARITKVELSKTLIKKYGKDKHDRINHIKGLKPLMKDGYNQGMKRVFLISRNWQFLPNLDIYLPEAKNTNWNTTYGFGILFNDEQQDSFYKFLKCLSDGNLKEANKLLRSEKDIIRDIFKKFKK